MTWKGAVALQFHAFVGLSLLCIQENIGCELLSASVALRTSAADVTRKTMPSPLQESKP
jgi:hypothetical protein